MATAVLQRPQTAQKKRWAANSLERLHIVGMLFVMQTIAWGRAAPQCCDTLSRELSVITGVFVGCTMIDLIHTRRIIRPLEKTCLFAVLCRKGGASWQPDLTKCFGKVIEDVPSCLYY